MRIYDIILKKRNGGILNKEEIDFFVKGYTSGEIPDYQASALMMAIFFEGMTDEETATLTESMALSGDTVDLSEFKDQSADKHSTGGVGDKTSLIVAPIVASLGGFVTKMSGRGLGHTGGTVDKLESIPGYKTELSEEDFLETVRKTGMAIIGQTGNLAPCDKKLYALRDVTATVDSIALITASIMSKKLAAGSKNIVLDVKWGSGAFMKTAEDAKKLAQNMVTIGKKCGRNMAALITDMNTPLGNNIGNSLEIIEAVEILKNQKECDLKEVSVKLSANIVALLKKIDLDEAETLVRNAISSGTAFNKMKEWIAFQGGDISYIEDTDKFKKAKFTKEVIAENDGYINKMDAEKIGIIACLLGAGREKKEDKIDFSAGIILDKKTGDFVKKGERLCTLFTNNLENFNKVNYFDAIELSQTEPEKTPLVYDTIR